MRIWFMHVYMKCLRFYMLASTWKMLISFFITYIPDCIGLSNCVILYRKFCSCKLLANFSSLSSYLHRPQIYSHSPIHYEDYCNDLKPNIDDAIWPNMCFDILPVQENISDIKPQIGFWSNIIECLISCLCKFIECNTWVLTRWSCITVLCKNKLIKLLF